MWQLKNKINLLALKKTIHSELLFGGTSLPAFDVQGCRFDDFQEHYMQKQAIVLDTSYQELSSNKTAFINMYGCPMGFAYKDSDGDRHVVICTDLKLWYNEWWNYPSSSYRKLTGITRAGVHLESEDLHLQLREGRQLVGPIDVAGDLQQDGE